MAKYCLDPGVMAKYCLDPGCRLRLGTASGIFFSGSWQRPLEQKVSWRLVSENTAPDKFLEPGSALPDVALTFESLSGESQKIEVPSCGSTTSAAEAPAAAAPAAAAPAAAAPASAAPAAYARSS